MHCILVLQGHQDGNEDQPSCHGLFFLSTLNTAWFSMWLVLTGVSPEAKFSWLQNLQPSESGRRETDMGSPMPKERSCCEITLQDIGYLHTAGRPGKLLVILLARK